MKPFDLTGKAALVTGGNGGIGLGMAQGLAAAGATVAIAGRDEKKNAAAAKELGGRAISIKADLRDEIACRAAVGAFVASQAAYPHMKRAGGGKIINIGSMMSLFGASFVAPYGASKGGIVQLTKALATAWAKDHIQVNAVLPGWIDTALTRQACNDVPGLHERVLARTPAGRWGAPEDLAGVAVFLSSSSSDFVTGAAIPVDGGYSAQG
jgi:2-deoxy-D-gluconate 3-dehydrogenase